MKDNTRIKRKVATNKKGISSIFIALYITMIATILGVTLLSALQISTASNIDRLHIEQEKEQETILVQVGSLRVTEYDFIESIIVNNTGAITVRLRGIYIDSNLIMDPSSYQNTYINPQESIEISIIDHYNISYSDNKFKSITVTTERGTKFSDLIINLFPNTGEGGDDTVYGPLRLLFEEFHWQIFDDEFDLENLRSNTWNEGWKVSEGTYLIWRVRIQNVGNRIINLRNGSCLSLISNEGGSRWTYYIDPICSDMSIHPKEYATIYFAWAQPNPSSRTQSDATSRLQTNDARACLTFLVFDGTYGYIPLGETIPFEAVLVTET